MKTIYAPAYGTLVGRLRRLRVERGWRQQDVGRQLGTTRHWVAKIESGQTRLDVVQLVRLCRVLGVSASRLVRELESDLPDDGSLFTYHTSCWYLPRERDAAISLAVSTGIVLPIHLVR